MPYKNLSDKLKWQRNNYASSRTPELLKSRSMTRKMVTTTCVTRNQVIIDKLKLQPCLDCKGNFHPSVMQFDHVPERGKLCFRIGSIGGKQISEQTLMLEIAKCDVVCANCHCLRTWKRNHPDQNP